MVRHWWETSGRRLPIEVGSLFLGTFRTHLTCVIPASGAHLRCRATPAEPFERLGIDEPFATSMTQLPMDRFETFIVYLAVEKHRVSGNIGCIKNSNLSARLL